MAKMIEETVIVTVTKLVTDDATDTTILPSDALAAMGAIVAELVQDDKALIEIRKLDAE